MSENIFKKSDLIAMTKESFQKQYQRILSKIIEAINWTDGNIVLCFSGGKDSALLLDMYCEAVCMLGLADKPIIIVYADTTNETSAMRKYVFWFIERCEKKYGVKIEKYVVRPANKDNFATVLKDEGIPFISKMTSSIVRKVTKDLLTNGITYQDIKHLHNPTVGCRDKLREMGLSDTTVLSLTGWSCRMGGFGKEFVLPKVYMPLLDLYQQIKIRLTEKCCIILKENPINSFDFPNMMTGEQALESKMRENSWLKNGCNFRFDNGRIRSKPLGSVSLNTILWAIRYRKIPICSDYGEIVSCGENCFKCTKAQRTGCALCGFGIKFEQDRFIRVQETEPAKIKFAFKPLNQGGAGYKELCEYTNEYCGFNIQIPKVG